MTSIRATHVPPGERPNERRIWLLISGACVIPAVLGVFQAYMQATLEGRPARWQDLVFEGGEWLFLGALLPITYHLGKRFPFRGAQWKRSLLVHVGGALALCVAWASLGLLLGFVLQRYPAQGNFPRDYLSWILISVPWSVFMYFTVLGCVHAVAYFNEAREREAHASRLAAQLAEARLGALRMQLHPHFLFNSLNALGVLVRDQNTAAAWCCSRSSRTRSSMASRSVPTRGGSTSRRGSLGPASSCPCGMMAWA